MFEVFVPGDEDIEGNGSEGVVDGDFRVGFPIEPGGVQAQYMDVSEVDFHDTTNIMGNDGDDSIFKG